MHAKARACSIVAGLWATLVAAGTARAQVAAAETMFEQGDKLLAAGKISEACEAFEASNNLDPRAGALIRIGDCRERNHQLATAWTAYKDALARAKDPRKRDLAKQKIDELEPRLSHLTVVVGAHAVPGLAITRDKSNFVSATWDQRLPVDGGTYTLTATAPGYNTWTMTVTVPAERGDVRAEMPALARVPEPVAPPVAVTAPVEPAPPVAGDQPSRWTGRRKLAIGAAGVAIAGGATGLVLGLLARSDHYQAFALCHDPTMPCDQATHASDLAASSHRLAIGADVGFAVGGGAAIAAVVLWLTGRPAATEPIAIIPTSNGVALGGRF